MIIGLIERLKNRSRSCVVLSVLIIGSGSVAHAQTLGTPPNITDTFDAANQVGFCIDRGGSGSCSANDFLITSIDIFNVDDGCTGPDDYLQIDANITFNKATPSRFDITGWFYRGDDQAALPNPDFINQDARNGDFCTRISLENNLTITDEDDASVILGQSGNLDPDSCPDVPNTARGNLEQTVENLVLPCRDIGTPDPADPQGILLSNTPDGMLDISGCTSWDNNANTTCDGPEFDGVNEPEAGTGSKCNCGEFSGITLQVGVPDISVTKSCTPEELTPGEPTRCTIEIINSGTGDQLGASAAGEEGFFYEDDYPEEFGAPAPGPINVVSVSQGSVDDAFVLNSDGSASSNRSLNIYPGTITAGSTATVVYDFTTDPGLPGTTQDITNTVCASFFDEGQDGSVEVFSYTFDDDLCASATVTTPVSLAGVDIAFEAGGIQLNWVTETESSNLGFNIYGRMGSTLYKLNDEIIPSQVISSLEPSVYGHWVADSHNGQIRKFYLEDIDLLGNPTMHGPFSLGDNGGTIQAASANRKATNWDLIRQSSQLSGANRQKGKKSATRSSKLDQSKFNLSLAASGLHRVGLAELAALGADEKLLKRGQFRLTDAAGADIPVNIVRGSGRQAGFIEFIARVERSFYSDDTVYQLEIGNASALQITEQSASKKSGKKSSNGVSPYYLHTETIADDVLYVESSSVDGDPWVLNQLFAINRAATANVSLPLSEVADDAGVAAQVTAQFVGGLDFNGGPDRTYSGTANGQTLFQETTDGFAVVTLSGAVTEPLNDSLAVSVTSTPVNNANVDVSYTNSVSVTYPRKYVAIDDRLSFSSADLRFRIEGFSSDQVRAYLQEDGSVSYLGSFPVLNGVAEISSSGATGGTYYVAGVDSLARAEIVASTASIDLDAGAEHLVISHPDFAGESLQGYLAQREQFSSGTSLLVTTEDIYSQFSGGVRDAEAIREFVVAYAARNNLQSVMLVGGDVYDYHDNLGIGAISFVPTLYRATSETVRFSPVDALFGDIDRDGFPDVGVGRLPVRTVDELDEIVAKMGLYAQQQGRQTAVLAADELRENNPYNFVESSEQVAAILEKKDWSIERTYIDVLGAASARSALLSALNQGPRLALYSGHSSSGVWSARSLFKRSDTASLTNFGSPSAYLQWGCYNTFFSSPFSDSMSHGLMLSGDQGAAVVIGSSTLTNAFAEEDFAVLIQAELLGGTLNMGQAMVAAKQRYGRQTGLRQKDIMWGVTLLGDPLLKL